ncbi:MFS transporter [Pseudonocardia halophobica]|uniref:MFS transporter n=1 Tax=Pseudonocardia halophobica TaxID=29401 RepID=UPI0018CBF5ED|nr:MFS transporter [Pseudonocardia halophobica]
MTAGSGAEPVRADPAPQREDHKRVRRASIAGLAGSMIEYYDFGSYAFLVVFIGPLFFPEDNSLISILATYGVFAVGYFARPLGALFFGGFGDRRGRRAALLVTVVGMGCATAAMGVLPTHDSIGVAAPILLVLLRLGQGFCAGGEQAGAATLIAESGGGRRHGLFQAFAPAGATLGSATAPAVVGLTTAVLGTDAMAAWGWRIPLLLSVVLTVVVLVLRLRVQESEDFTALAKTDRVARSPLRGTVKVHWRRILAVILLALAVNAPGAVLLNYMNVFLINTVQLPRTTVFWMSAVCIALGTSGYFLGGILTDRFGATRVVVGGLAAVAAVIYPMFLLVQGGRPVGFIGVVYTVALICYSIATTPVYAIATRAFPTRFRYSGVAVGMNIGGALGAGLAPLAAASLVASTGSPQSPALLVVGVALLGVTVALAVSRSAALRGEQSSEAGRP